METRPRKLHTQVHSRMISGAAGGKLSNVQQWLKEEGKGVRPHSGVRFSSTKEWRAAYSVEGAWTRAQKRSCVCMFVFRWHAHNRQIQRRKETPAAEDWGHRGEWGVSAHSYRACSGQDGGGTDGRSPPSTHWKPESPLSEADSHLCVSSRAT